jgi:hypothetical protein
MMQKKLQMKNAEDAAGEIHHTLETQNLEQSLKELRIQLADKTSQIDSYEKVRARMFASSSQHVRLVYTRVMNYCPALLCLHSFCPICIKVH